VLIALVYNGPINAVVMLGGVLLVNQIESHLLHPLLMGGAVRLHPIAVVLAVASGSVLAGIIGALFAVPLTAAANSAIKYLASGEWKRRPGSPAVPPPGEGGSGPKDGDPAPQDVTVARGPSARPTAHPVAGAPTYSRSDQRNHRVRACCVMTE
jgi:hypothetical protein